MSLSISFLFSLSNELNLAKFVDFLKAKLIDFPVHFISLPVATIFKFSLIPSPLCRHHVNLPSPLLERL